jgi:hypothetical protein
MLQIVKRGLPWFCVYAHGDHTSTEPPFAPCHRPIPVGSAVAAVDPNAIPGSVCVRVSKGEDLPQVESKQDPYVHMALATSHGTLHCVLICLDGHSH